jgi:hypothetical protein
MVLARSWRNWRTALIVVQPDTVIRWHRDWRRRRWTRRSQPRHHGRPPIDPQVRALVREMAKQPDYFKRIQELQQINLQT